MPKKQTDRDYVLGRLTGAAKAMEPSADAAPLLRELQEAYSLSSIAISLKRIADVLERSGGDDYIRTCDISDKG